MPTVVFGDGRLCRAAICSGFQAITCSKPKPVQVKRDNQPAKPVDRQSVGRPQGEAGPEMITRTVNRNTTRFRYPKIKNVRVDWCRNWGSNCGEPAANLFCQEMGFDRANRFIVDKTTGRQGIPSLVFGDGRVCNARYCNAFKLIACTRRQAQPDVAEQVEPEQETEVAFAAPVPTPKPPPKPEAEPLAKPAVQPKPIKPDAGEIKPAVDFAGFEPLAPTVVAVNWVNLLDSINQYPAGASLFKCASGDCSIANSADFEINPDAPVQSTQLNFRVDSVPHASGALWQVSYLPFPPFAQGSEPT